MKKNKISIITPSASKVRAEIRDKAMPEVKAIVKKFGRQSVAWCVSQLAEYERKMKKLERAKEEVAKMEKELD